MVIGDLARRLPPEDASDDMILERFLEHVSSLGIDLYPAQEEAILEVFAGKNVILNTPTGSGKSLVAAALHFRALARGHRSFYTSPIKALQGIGAKGIVFAGTGAGGISKLEKEAVNVLLAQPHKPVLVRSNRTGNGRVIPREEYDKLAYNIRTRAFFQALQRGLINSDELEKAESELGDWIERDKKKFLKNDKS